LSIFVTFKELFGLLRAFKASTTSLNDPADRFRGLAMLVVSQNSAKPQQGAIGTGSARNMRSLRVPELSNKRKSSLIPKYGLQITHWTFHEQ
jgi:hypothetical protein